MQGMYCLFLMSILSFQVQVTAKLWEIDPIAVVKETPKEPVVEKETVPPKEPVVEQEIVATEEKVTEQKAVAIEEPVIKQVDQKSLSCSKPSNYNDVILKQFIGKLLDQFEPVVVPGSSEEKMKYYVEMKLSALDLNKLSLFMNDNGDIYEVEEILTSILGDVSSEQFLEMLPRTFAEKYYRYIMGGIVILLLLFMFFSLKVIHLSTWMLIKWSTFATFIVSFIWNWYFLYKMNYTKYMSAIEKGPPEACKQNYKKGFFESLQSQIGHLFHVSSDKCEEYHEITSIPPALRVPPTEAISVCIVNTLLKPMSSLGENVGLFFHELSQKIPIHLQILATSCLMIIILVIIFMWNGYTISSIFISIKPPPPPTPTPSLQIEDINELTKKLENILAALKNVPDAQEMRDMQKLFLRYAKQELSRNETQNFITSGDGSGDFPPPPPPLRE